MIDTCIVINYQYQSVTELFIHSAYTLFMCNIPYPVVLECAPCCVKKNS